MPQNFHELGLMPELVQTVSERGYIAPTPIQAEAIPYLLAGHDVMGQAQTGTGKTAAFTLPMVQRLEGNGLQTLILTPTRELAIQTAEAVYQYGHKLGIRVLPVYGGQPYQRQIRRLQKGVDVVVGTPGRTLDLINKNALDLRDVHYVVLDEADEMLKMGFIDDVEAILNVTDADTRQTVLFSATLPAPIKRLGGKYMRDPMVISIEGKQMTVENITQRYYLVNEQDKVAALSRLLEVEDLQNTLIFSRTKVGSAELAETLMTRGYPAEAIHGDLAQAERERILRRFRNGQLTILVATDVVARGVDIPAVSHVINFDMPQKAIEYVHRVGRTGRAGRGGDAITLVTPRQRRQLKNIEQYTRKQITKAQLPETEVVLRRRDEHFKAQLVDQINGKPFNGEYSLIEELVETGYAPEDVAAAAFRLLRANESQRPLEAIRTVNERPDRRDRDEQRVRGKRDNYGNEAGMVRLQMNAGRSQGIRPADVVYGIASEARIPGRSIGAIDILDNETYLDVPEAHVNAVLSAAKLMEIRGLSVTLKLAGDGYIRSAKRRRSYPKFSKKKRRQRT